MYGSGKCAGGGCPVSPSVIRFGKSVTVSVITRVFWVTVADFNFSVHITYGYRCSCIRVRSTTTRDRNQQFRDIVSTGCWGIFLQWSFSLFSNRPKMVRKSPGGAKSVESCHVSGCHWFFRSQLQILRYVTVSQRTVTFGQECQIDAACSAYIARNLATQRTLPY